LKFVTVEKERARAAESAEGKEREEPDRKIVPRYRKEKKSSFTAHKKTGGGEGMTMQFGATEREKTTDKHIWRKKGQLKLQHQRKGTSDLNAQEEGGRWGSGMVPPN